MITVELKDGLLTKLLLAKKGKSLRSFSQKIGISHAYLSQVLNKKRNPSVTVAFKIANGLGVDVEEIFLIKVVDVSTGREVKS